MQKTLRVVVMLAAALSAAVPAYAQMAQPTLRQGRPTRGLFGGGTGDTAQQLVFNASLGAGYDWDKGGQVVGADGTTTPAPLWTGSFASGSASLSYDVARKRINAGLSVGTTARYNPDLPDSLMRSLGASAHVSSTLTERTTIAASHGIGSQPFNLQRLFGTAFEAESSPDVFLDLGGSLAQENLFSSQSAVSLGHNISRRIAFSAGYQHSYNRFAGNSSTASRTHNLAGGISYQVFRGARLRVGYSQTSTQFGANAPVKTDGVALDGGLMLDRAISLSRRTTFNFAAGVTGAKDELSHTHYFLTGNAALRYEIGRSWTASVNYRRGVDFNLGFTQPVVLDTVSAAVGGVVGRRLQLSGGGGAAWGALGVGPGARDYTIGNANASARVALTRLIGIAVSYAYRNFEFSDLAALPVGFRPNVERQSVRITMDLWIPLILRARSGDAAR